jgi:hypothetical protein
MHVAILESSIKIPSDFIQAEMYLTKFVVANSVVDDD